jgi:hypothetical protein
MGRAAWTCRTRQPGDPKPLSNVGEMISAHLGRETAAQDEGGSEKKGKGEQAEAAPRAF